MKVQNNIQEYADIITKNFEERIKTIMGIKYHYDLLDLFNGVDTLSKKEQNDIYEKLINDYLQKIKGIDSNIIFDRKQEREIDDITDFFDYDSYLESKNNKCVDDYCIEEAENIVTDFISKMFNKKGRSLTLPITIQNIEDYGVNSIISGKDMKKVIFWIVLKLSVIYNYSVVNSK